VLWTRLSLAIETLRRLEDAVATVEEHSFGGVFRCSAAPTLASLNFVRVDRATADISATVIRVGAHGCCLGRLSVLEREHFTHFRTKRNPALVQHRRARRQRRLHVQVVDEQPRELESSV
jgi:hypothetical protein